MKPKRDGCISLTFRELHSSIQQIFEFLLYAEYYFRYWEYNSEQNKKNFCMLLGVYIPMGEAGNKQTNEQHLLCVKISKDLFS